MNMEAVEKMARIERSVWLSELPSRLRTEAGIRKIIGEKFQYQLLFSESDKKSCIVTFEKKKGVKTFMTSDCREFRRQACDEVSGMIWNLEANMTKQAADERKKHKLKSPGVTFKGTKASSVSLALLMTCEQDIIKLLPTLKSSAKKSEKKAKATTTSAGKKEPKTSVPTSTVLRKEKKVFDHIKAELVPWLSYFYDMSNDDVTKASENAQIVVKYGIINSTSLGSLQIFNEVLMNIQKHSSEPETVREGSSVDNFNVMDKKIHTINHDKKKGRKDPICREIHDNEGGESIWKPKIDEAVFSETDEEAPTLDKDAQIDKIDSKDVCSSTKSTCREKEERAHPEVISDHNRQDKFVKKDRKKTNYIHPEASGSKDDDTVARKYKKHDENESEDHSFSTAEEIVEPNKEIEPVRGESPPSDTESSITANMGTVGNTSKASPVEKDVTPKKRTLMATLKSVRNKAKPNTLEKSITKTESFGSSEDSTTTSTKISKNKSGKNEIKAMAHQRGRIQDTPSDNSSKSDDLSTCLEKQRLDRTTAEGINVSVYVGDITKERSDVIVNAANGRLRHGGGVSKAIVDAGGFRIKQESDKYVGANGYLNPGQFCHTSAGKLKANYVVHAVGPKWNSMDKDQAVGVLHQMLLNLFEYAGSMLNARSLASPAISTGQYGMPLEVCANVFVNAINEFSASKRKPKKLRDIHIVLFDKEALGEFILAFAGIRDHDVEGNKSKRTPSPDFDHPLPGLESSKKPTLSNEAFSEHVNGAVGGITSFPALSTRDIADPCKKNGDCDICADEDVQLMSMKCCRNTFCLTCFNRHFSSDAKCPFCTVIVLLKEGNQPKGKMRSDIDMTYDLPGHEGHGMIIIDYVFRDGIQQDNHPNPGVPYSGTHRRAFLPASKEGKYILKLLRKAFDMKYLFTIGKSVTTGRDNCVVWNDIHHKTNIDGGAGGYGYPDPTYLSRVREELAAKGIK